MDKSYKSSISPIDFNRSISAIEYLEFTGMDRAPFTEFSADIEGNNDSIELHLVRTKAYKEALVLDMPPTNNPEQWETFLKEEQKTFGGSKIFYLNKGCSKVLILSVKNELMNKLNMVITRINKVNEKIHRYNTLAKKENLEMFETRMKKGSSKEDEIAHFIAQHLKI